MMFIGCIVVAVRNILIQKVDTFVDIHWEKVEQEFILSEHFV